MSTGTSMQLYFSSKNHVLKEKSTLARCFRNCLSLHALYRHEWLDEWLDDWRPVRNICVTTTPSMRILLLCRRSDHMLYVYWMSISLFVTTFVFVGVSIVIVLGIALIIGLIVLAVGLLVLRRYDTVVVPNVCQIVCACSLTCRPLGGVFVGI